MTDRIDAFIARWAASGASERANYQLFLTELCELLDVPRPDPLARRIDSSPAYITKVMRGDTNFTVESMVRLARAVDGKLCIHVGRREDEVRWFDVVQRKEPRQLPTATGFRWIEVDEHNVEGESDEPGTAVA